MAASPHTLHSRSLAPGSVGELFVSRPGLQMHRRCMATHRHSWSRLCAAKPASSNGAPSSSSSGTPVSQIIADVLNEDSSSRRQSAASLLDLLDSAAGSLTTRLVRSWEGRGVALELRGRWEGGLEARRMAMLPVYQERIYNDNALIKAALDLVVATRPGLLSKEVVARIEGMHAVNMITGTLEAMGPAELTQLAVALLPMERLEQLVEDVVEEARAAVSKQAWATRDEASRTRTRRSLGRARAAMQRHLRLCLLRLRLWPDIDRCKKDVANMLQDRDQRSDLWVPQPTKLKPAAGGVDDEQLYFQGRIHTYRTRAAGGTGAVTGGATAGGVGRSGAVAFGRTPGPRALGVRLGRDGAGAAGLAGFGGCLLPEGRALEAAMQEVQSMSLRPDEASPGVSIELAKLHRTALIRELCAWASGAGLIQQQLRQQRVRCLQAVRMQTAAREQVARRLELQVEGQELQLLRHHATLRGRSFLASLSPLPGVHPLGEAQEWEYTREAPMLWSRFVTLPSVVEGLTLILKQQQQEEQQQQHDPVAAVQLQQRELTELVTSLLRLVPATVAASGSSSSSSGVQGMGRCRAAGPWLPSDSAPFQLRLAPGSMEGMAAPGVGAAAVAPSLYEVRWQMQQQQLASADLEAAESAPAAASASLASLRFSEPVRLSQEQLQDMIAVFDTVSSQLPQLLLLPQHVVAHLPPAAGADSGSGTRGLAAAARPRPLSLGAAAANLAGHALRLLALAGLAAVPLLGGSRLRASVLAGTGAGNYHAATSQVQQHQQQQRQPVNSELSAEEMRKLCQQVEQMVAGKVVLPKPKEQQQQQRRRQQGEEKQEQQAPVRLRYQVMVDRHTEAVVGCMPFDRAAAAAYQQLPLAAAIRGPSYQRSVARHAEAVQKLAAPGSSGSARADVPAFSASYEPARLVRPSEGGLVVLHMDLRQPGSGAAASAAAAAADTQIAEVHVRPWSDRDSVESWLSQGTDLPPDAVAQADAAPGSSSGSKLQLPAGMNLQEVLDFITREGAAAAAAAHDADGAAAAAAGPDAGVAVAPREGGSSSSSRQEQAPRRDGGASSRRTPGKLSRFQQVLKDAESNR